MSDPHYPIRELSYTSPLTAEQKQQYLTDVEQTPARLRAALRGLLRQQLDTTYRDGGWTLRQVAHQVADSHMNSYLKRTSTYVAFVARRSFLPHGSPVTIKHLARRSCNLTLVGADGDPSAMPGNRTRKACADYPPFLFPEHS